MKKLFLLLSLFFVSIATFSNVSDGRVYGSVIDGELKDPIPYATVIINGANGNLLSGGITEEDGTFSINKIPYGTYTVKIQFMGYKTFSTEIELSDKQASYNLEIIELNPDMAM